MSHVATGRDFIEAYEQGVALIEASVEGLSEEVMSYAPDPERWCIHEILLHLADSEIVGSERFRRVIAEENAQLLAYDEDAWGRHLHYREQNPWQALNLFRMLREMNGSLLRLMPASAWERVGVHSQRGLKTLAQVVEDYIEHVQYHLRQIEELKGMAPGR